MSSNRIAYETQSPEAREQTGQGMPQQGIQVSPELQQQISILNARINNANFAYSDLLKAMNDTFRMMAIAIVTLQRENDELKQICRKQ